MFIISISSLVLLLCLLSGTFSDASPDEIAGDPLSLVAKPEVHSPPKLLTPLQASFSQPPSSRPSSSHALKSLPPAPSSQPRSSSKQPSSMQPSSRQPSSRQPSSRQPSSRQPSSRPPSSRPPSSRPPSSRPPSSRPPSSKPPSSKPPSSRPPPSSQPPSSQPPSIQPQTSVRQPSSDQPSSQSVASIKIHELDPAPKSQVAMPPPTDSAAKQHQPPVSAPPLVQPTHTTPRLSGVQSAPPPLTSLARRNLLKPHISEHFTPHLFKFETSEPPFLNCLTVYETLKEEEASGQAFVHFFNVIMLLVVPPDDPNGEMHDLDKDCMTSLNMLPQHMVQTSAQTLHSSNLIDFMDRIVRCKVDMENGRGIIQKMVERGLTKCLKTPFALELFRGAPGHETDLQLDMHGNTLMHLAVMANSYAVPETLFQLEGMCNSADSSRKMNGIYWLLSSLKHQNKEGKRPLDLCTSPSLKLQLKRYFRTYATHLRLLAKFHGINDPVDPAVELFLKSSTSPPSSDHVQNTSVAPAA